MVQFRVRATSLGEVAAHLQTAVAVFDGHMASTESVVSSVVGASWEGADADAFTEQWQALRAQSDLVRLALTALAGQLVAAEGGYTSTESGLVNAGARTRQNDRVMVQSVLNVSESVEDGQALAAAAVAPTLVTASGGAAMLRPGAGQQVQERVAAESVQGAVRFGGAQQSQQSGGGKPSTADAGASESAASSGEGASGE